MNDDNKIIEYEREREWLRNSAWGQWWPSGNTETKTLTTNDVYILLVAYGAECVRAERKSCTERLMSECRQFNEEATRACKHGNYELRDKLEMKANLCERLATTIEREG